MATLVESFKKELADLRNSNPSDHQYFNKLLWLALEREAMVSMAYRENLLHTRLQTLQVSDEIKIMMTHAFYWVWQDEDLHTTFTRSLVFNQGNFIRRLRVLNRQWAGGIGGWSTSIIQHSQWRRAPLAKLLAHSIAFAGYLLSKVPQDAIKHLKFGAFQNFTQFNIAAEETAYLCWLEILTLAKKLSYPASTISDLEKICNDELNHKKIFELFNQFDQNNQLPPHLTALEIKQQLSEISEYFLPYKDRKKENKMTHLSTNVWCRQGTSEADKLKTFMQIFDECGLLNKLDQECEKQSVAKTQLKIAIKVPYMMTYDRKDPSPHIDLTVLKAFGEKLYDSGYSNLYLIENPNIYTQFYEGRSVPEVANYLDLGAPFQLVDGDKDRLENHYHRGLGFYQINKTWKEANFRISFGKLRSHPTESALGVISNLEGVGPRWDEFLFFDRRTNYHTAQVMLMDACPPDFCLLDAFENIPDGLVGVMGHPRSKNFLRFYASENAISLDETLFSHLGINKRDSTKVLTTTKKWFGIETSSAKVIGDNSKIKSWQGPHSNDLCALLSLSSLFIYEYFGRGALFVPKMDPRQFPEKTQPGILLKLGRIITAWFLGLRFYFYR